MSFWQVVMLGILQGATEFLPVSSSGHLVIVPYLLGWPDPGLPLDTVLHLGTLVAIMVYFWRDLWRLAQAGVLSVYHRSLAEADARVAWCVVLATVPGVFAGLVFEDYFEALFGNPQAVAGFLLVTAVLLVVAEYLGRRVRTLDSMTWLDAGLIGIAQAFAIAPGLSRSGATIATGLLRGYRRDEAARFSFLMAVPIILGSGGYQVIKILRDGAGNVQLQLMAVGFIAAALSGYLAIAGFLALIRRQSLWPFALYCAILGGLVLSGVVG